MGLMKRSVSSHYNRKNNWFCHIFHIAKKQHENTSESHLAASSLRTIFGHNSQQAGFISLRPDALASFFLIVTLSSVVLTFASINYFREKGISNSLAPDTAKTSMRPLTTLSADIGRFGDLTLSGDAKVTGDIYIKGEKLIIPAFTAGEGISIDGKSDITISNTGVTSFQSKTGDLKLKAGNGITIDGLTITNNAPNAIQSTFEFIKVTNNEIDTTFGASKSNDTLTFVAGGNINIASDTTNKKVTISSTATGWQLLGSSVYLSDSTYNVGIGTSAPNNKLVILSTTTPQLRLAYDTSNYYTTAVSSTGAVTFDTNGTVPSFTFSDAVTANTLSSSGATITGGSINGTTIGASTPSTGAFTTLTSSGNTTLGTGASSINAIGSTTTPGTLTLHGATTLDNTFTVSGSNLTSLGGNLTVTGTAWTATPTISGLVTMTSGFDSNTASTVTGLTVDGAGNLTVSDGLTSLTSSATTASTKALSVSQTGATVGTDYAGYFNNTGAATTNVGLYATATGGTNNYAAIFEAGNVGIGITNPGDKLDVVGGVSFYNNTSGGQQIQFDPNNSGYLKIQGWNGAGASALPIALQPGGGNVGIGTTNPSSYYHGGSNKVIEVYNSGTAASSQAHLILSTGATTNLGGAGTISWMTPNSSGNKGLAYINAILESNSATNAVGALTFATDSDGLPDERMRITSAGLVGIGTTTPTSLLDVNNTTTSAITAGANARILNIQGALTEAASGVHARIMGVEITPPTITAGVATVTDTASLYISAAPTATVTGGNYALWVDAGNVRLDGHLGIGSAGTVISRDIAQLAETGSGDATTFHGLALFPTANATISNLRGAYVQTATTATAITVTDNTGLYIDNPSLGAGSTITNSYGLLIAGQTRGTSDYGIRVDLADTQTLWVNGSTDSTTAAGGIAFGSSRDTNLYRSAASTLKTDGALVVGSTATATTSLTAPIIYGGTTTTSTLSLRSTSGVGAAGADIIFGVGTAGGTEAMRIINSGNVGIGTTAPGALLDVDTADATGAGATETIQFRSAAQSITLADGTTRTNQRQAQFIAPTLSGVLGGLTETVTNAATLYINAAPVNGGNLTLSNAYALWVDDGAVKFDSTLTVDSNITATGTLDAIRINNAGANQVYFKALNTAGALEAGVFASGIGYIGTVSATNFQIFAHNTLAATINSGQQLQLATVGSGAGLLIGGDAQLFRGAADRLDLASGDSFNIVNGSATITKTVALDTYTPALSVFNNTGDPNPATNSVISAIEIAGANGLPAGQRTYVYDRMIGGTGGYGYFSGRVLRFEVGYAALGARTLAGEFSSVGQFALPVIGSSAGILLGGDTQLYRSAANIMSLASGDSLYLESGQLRVRGTGGHLIMLDKTDNVLDEKKWDFAQGATTFLGRAMNDAENSTSNWLTVTRSAMTITGIDLAATTVTIPGSGGVTIGADTNLSRGAANRLDLASGDSFYLVSGQLGVAAVPTSARGINLAQSGAKTAADYGTYIANTSTSSTASVHKYGGYISSTGIWNGASANNYGLYIDTVSGGTSNFGLAIAAAATQTLWLSADADNTTAAAGIAFGLSRDTNLYRSAANTLVTDANFRVGNTASNAVELFLDSKAATTTEVLRTSVQGDAAARLTLSASGTLAWGNGTSVVDTNLYRSAADTLKTDDNFVIAGTTGLTFTGVGGRINFTNGGTIDNNIGGQITVTAGVLDIQSYAPTAINRIIASNSYESTSTAYGANISRFQSGSSNANSIIGVSGNGHGYSLGLGNTLAWAKGIVGTAGHNGGTNPGTVTNAAALYASSILANSGGATTSGYGLYVESQTAATNDYGVYIAGADTYALWINAGTARFDGNVGIGTTAPAATLDVLTAAATTGFNLAGTAPAAVAGNGTSAATNTLVVVGTAGGASSGVTGQTGGTGGALSLTSGIGGAVAGAGGIGGAGGGLTLAGGAGGNGAATGGAGGAVSITAGAAGTGGNANGGTLTLNSGAVTGTGTSTINLGSANTTNLNIGTAAVADTITIGNATGATSLALNSGTGSQTFTSKVVTGTTTTSAFVFNDTVLTSGTLGYLTSSSITTGKLLSVADTGNTWTGNGTTNGLIDLTSSSTAGAASATSILLNLSRSGVNAQLAHTAYGIYSNVTNTNVTSGTNVAGYFSASGATTANYGLIVANGSVGIGTTAPTAPLEIKTSTAGVASDLFINSQNAGAFIGMKHVTATNTWFLGQGVDTANDFAILEGTTNRRLTISAGGNVGIGTTAPSHPLSVVGNIQDTTMANAIATITNNYSGNTAGEKATALRINLGAATANTTDNYFVQFFDGVTTGDTGGTRIGDIRKTNGADSVAYQTTAGDFAERFPLTEATEFGDIIGTTSTGNRKAMHGDSIIGVVSNTAGFIGNQNYREGFNEAMNPIVGLLGQVDTKVSLENGPIAIGDPITSSSVPGVGMRATRAGMVVGTALEPYNGTGSDTKILIFVNPRYFLGTAIAQTVSEDPLFSLLDSVGVIKNQYQGQVLSSNQVQKLINEQSAVLGIATSETATLAASLTTLSGTVGALETHLAAQKAAIASISATLANLPVINLTQFATGSAVLGITIVKEDFAVTGNTTLSNLNTIGNITVANNLTLGATSINTVGEDLQIQPLKQGNISFMNGLVTIDTTGNVVITGNVSADSLSLAKDKTIGSSTILAGTTSITITTTAVDANSKIFLTPTASTSSKIIYISNKTPGTGFTASLDGDASTTDTLFDWLIVKAKP